MGEAEEFQIPEKKIDESWKETVDRERHAKSPTQAKPTPRPPDQPEATTPASFEALITNLAMQASMALGLAPNPATGQGEVHPEQAKFIVDLLGVLKEKTKGNLSEAETGLLDQLLYELRVAFLQRVK